jgi:hypothetical protein
MPLSSNQDSIELSQPLKLNLSQISREDENTLQSKFSKEGYSEIKLSSGKRVNKLTEMRVIRNRTNLASMRQMK